MTHVVDSLLELMFDAGITVQQFNYVLRHRAVRAATNRVIKETGRNSKSRVSIITGLSRSEVTKISKSPDTYIRSPRGQSPTRRILAAWFENPRFLDANGEPASLPIFGRNRSFEQLVSLHGGGIPVRAMLDELIQLDAIERVGDTSVRAKSRTPVSIGLTPIAVASLGERCSDLLQTLMKNLRRSEAPLFEGTSIVLDADLEMMPVIRREIARQSATFINGTNSLLKRTRRNSTIGNAKRPPRKCRAGVTVFYFEDLEPNTPVSSDRKRKRTNLRRIRAKKPK